MAIAILYGAGSGALHAVTGPDHVLSLGPTVLRQPRGSFRIGLSWGVGHALGTLLLALPVIALSQWMQLPQLALWGERAAGLALLLAAAWSYRSLRRAARSETADTRQPFLVGVVHGATGAGSLLLLLPMLVSGSLQHTWLFLGAFSAGSALAMGALTAAIARVGAKMSPALTQRLAGLAPVAAAVLGAYWLLS
jgi:nickel/cobalt transporter (NicO) family protein